ncbi:hypothetical protein HYALB_00007023 [Hymenoscyphus albidus]|uniref:Aminoglycoside phosphotransferase domain-containing protein n=1 Tax=Hymenoscyphus albidus TaxID=595503 RepID=A0A9N9LNA5_9HELO|nr:hypothetical protein HYALB_00007023 [Hymenoscyphus albidus]
MESNVPYALRVVQSANLRHPDLPLVEIFLQNAADSEQAARYFLQTYTDDVGGSKFTQFADDWKCLVKKSYIENPHSKYLDSITKRAVAQRDNNSCCILGTRSRFWNSSGLFPVIPLTAFYIKEKRLYDLLGAFIGSSHRDFLLSARDGDSISPRNHWYLGKSVAMSFSTGELQLEHISNAMYDIRHNSGVNSSPFIIFKRICHWQCNLIDHSATGIQSPDSRLLEIHRRFAPAMRWTDISAKMERRKPRTHKPPNRNAFSEILIKSALTIWKIFPDFIRLQTYKMLAYAGLRLYGKATRQVQRLPFGMFMKFDAQERFSPRIMNEFNALTLPRPIDLIVTSNGSYLISSQIKGVGAGYALDECSDEEMHVIAQDLQKYIAELRTIQQKPDSTYAISNPSGGPFLDYRIDVSPVGPFPTERDFSDSLRLGGAPDVVHRDDHQIVFTHADINLRNIILRDGRIEGIVDWENAGWYPEYWEYTKCRFGVRVSKRWLKMLEELFDHKYEEELKIEQVYWELDSGM